MTIYSDFASAKQAGGEVVLPLPDGYISVTQEQAREILGLVEKSAPSKPTAEARLDALEDAVLQLAERIETMMREKEGE